MEHFFNLYLSGLIIKNLGTDKESALKHQREKMTCLRVVLAGISWPSSLKRPCAGCLPHRYLCCESGLGSCELATARIVDGRLL